MNLLNSETKIATDIKGLNLTTLCIRYAKDNFLSSTSLKEVSPIHYKKEHNLIPLVIGIFMALVAGLMVTTNPGLEIMVTSVSAIIFIAWYVITGKTKLDEAYWIDRLEMNSKVNIQDFDEK